VNFNISERKIQFIGGRQTSLDEYSYGVRGAAAINEMVQTLDSFAQQIDSRDGKENDQNPTPGISAVLDGQDFKGVTVRAQSAEGGVLYKDFERIEIEREGESFLMARNDQGEWISHKSWTPGSHWESRYQVNRDGTLTQFE
jgi:hypothetical protein